MLITELFNIELGRKTCIQLVNLAIWLLQQVCAAEEKNMDIVSDDMEEAECHGDTHRYDDLDEEYCAYERVIEAIKFSIDTLDDVY